MICARCDQPIRANELYHKATRADLVFEVYEPDSIPVPAIVAGDTVIVHDYPCLLRFTLSERTNDSLEWEIEQSHHDDGDTHVAHLPWRRNEFLSSPYYRVYPWKDGWAYNRNDHPDLDKLTGWAQTLEAAKGACDQDFAIVARLHRWHLHMINQEPPS